MDRTYGENRPAFLPCAVVYVSYDPTLQLQVGLVQRCRPSVWKGSSSTERCQDHKFVFLQIRVYDR